MLKGLYILYDRISGSVFGSIIQELTDGAAVRTFHDALANKEGSLHAHARDYSLLFIGYIGLNGIISDGTTDLVSFTPREVATGEQWLDYTGSSQPAQQEMFK